MAEAQTYRVSGTLKHEGQTFGHGSEFTTDDEQLVKRLRGTLVLPEEYAAEEAASGNLEAQAQLAAERAADKAHIAELEAQLAAMQAKKSSKSESAE